MAQPFQIEELLQLYGTDVLRFIRFYTKNDNDAEDLTQEVFIRAHKGLKQFRGDCTAKTWLIQIAVNVCRNYYRTQARHAHVSVHPVSYAGLSPSAESEVVERSDCAELIGFIQDLPVAQKEVILLH